MFLKFASLAIVAGMALENKQSSKRMFLKFVRLPIEVGMEPYAMQLVISSVCKSTRFPIALSIGLGRLQPCIVKLLKVLKLLIRFGVIAEKLPPKSVKLIRFFCCPIHEKIDPNSLTDHKLRSNWHRDPSLLVGRDSTVKFPSRLKSFNDLKSLSDDISLA
jgi:hypothetical protein